MRAGVPREAAHRLLQQQDQHPLSQPGQRQSRQSQPPQGLEEYHDHRERAGGAEERNGRE